MKKPLLLAIFLGIATIMHTLQAQSVEDERAMRAFAREFMAAYNRQEILALMSMYTDDIEGAEDLAQSFEDRFTRQDITLLVRHHRVVSSDGQQTLVAVGTYEDYGATYAYDTPFSGKSAYRHTMVLEDGRWRIAKLVFTPLVKTFIYQKTGDLSEWTSALTEALPESELLSVDIGTPPDNPKAVYALIEWLSIENAKAFFKTPAWQKVIQQVSKVEKPTVVFLGKKQ